MESAGGGSTTVAPRVVVVRIFVVGCRHANLAHAGAVIKAPGGPAPQYDTTMAKPLLRVSWRLVALFIIGACAIQPATVDAHARLVDSTPVSSSALDVMPGVITLSFSEPVVLASVSLDLTRDDGSRIALAGIQLAGKRSSAFRHHRSDSTQPGHVPARMVGAVGERRSRLHRHRRLYGRDRPSPNWNRFDRNRARSLVANRAARDLATRAGAVAAGWISSFALRERLHPAMLVGAGIVSGIAPLLILRTWSGLELSSVSPRLQLFAVLLVSQRQHSCSPGCAWPASCRVPLDHRSRPGGLRARRRSRAIDRGNSDSGPAHRARTCLARCTGGDHCGRAPGFFRQGPRHLLPTSDRRSRRPGIGGGAVRAISGLG